MIVKKYRDQCPWLCFCLFLALSISSCSILKDDNKVINSNTTYDLVVDLRPGSDFQLLMNLLHRFKVTCQEIGIEPILNAQGIQRYEISLVSNNQEMTDNLIKGMSTEPLRVVSFVKLIH